DAGGGQGRRRLGAELGQGRQAEGGQGGPLRHQGGLEAGRRGPPQADVEAAGVSDLSRRAVAAAAGEDALGDVLADPDAAGPVGAVGDGADGSGQRVVELLDVAGVEADEDAVGGGGAGGGGGGRARGAE